MARRSTLAKAVLSVSSLLALVLVGEAVAGAVHPSRGGWTRGEAPRNHRAGEHQAEARLRALHLPPGSFVDDDLPRTVRNRLAVSPCFIDDGEHASGRFIHRRAFWTTPLAPGPFLRWARRQPPVGSHYFGSSTGTAPAAAPITETWEWPFGPRVLSSSVSVKAVAFRGGSAVRLDSEAFWRLPRPAAEHVPSDARIADLRIETTYAQRLGADGEEEGEARPQFRSLRISNPVAVRRLVRLVNRLPVAQWQIDHCAPDLPLPFAPGETAPPLPSTIFLRFRAGRHQPALATIVQGENPGACSPMEFRRRGVRMVPLEGGERVLRAILPQRQRAR